MNTYKYLWIICFLRFYNELQIQNKRRGYWQDYDNIRNEALKYKLYKDFSRECPDGRKYTKRMGWIDDFIGLRNDIRLI